jgi:hypothetical protein
VRTALAVLFGAFVIAVTAMTLAIPMASIALIPLDPPTDIQLLNAAPE